MERRTAGADGLTIETRLFELNGQTLGRCVPLATLPACAELVPQLVLPGVQGVGLAVLKTPLMNCVDGSTDAVSIYAPAAGLLHALARCEEQLNAEFANGASRVFASEDLLRPDAQGRRALQDDLFVGLPDDPANVGVTVYSPTLREGSYLARKQDLLRGCESLLGLRRGILSEVETPAEPRNVGGLRPDDPRPAECVDGYGAAGHGAVQCAGRGVRAGRSAADRSPGYRLGRRCFV